MFFSPLEKRIFWGALAVRLLLLFLILWFGGVEYFYLGDDAPKYFRLAEHLIEGRGFADVYEGGVYVPDSLRTPGYPLYLALFFYLGLPLWLASIVQIIFLSLLPIFAMRIVRLIFDNKMGSGDSPGGLVEKMTGFFTAFEPLQIYYSVMLTSDSFNALLFILSIYLFLVFLRDGRPSLLMASSASLAAATYVRPLGVFFSALMAAIILVRECLDSGKIKKAFIHSLIFLLLFVVLMSPWAIRNYRTFGVAAISSYGPGHLYTHAASTVIAVKEGISFDQARSRLISRIEPELPEPRDIYGFANASLLGKEGLKIVAAHPREFAKAYIFSLQTLFMTGNYHWLLADNHILNRPTGGAKSFTLMFSSRGVLDSLGELFSFIREPFGMIALLGRIYWGLLFLLSLAGAAVLWGKMPRARPLVALYAGSILYLALATASIMTGIVARNRLFINPLIFIFAWSAIFYFWRMMIDFIKKRRYDVLCRVST